MTPLPTVDEAYITRIYADLGDMEVELDADPLRYGPKRLNGKVAGCRRQLNRCQQIYLQLSSDLQQFKRAHRQAKLDYDLQMQDMFANDPNVRAGKNVRDREAIAGTKLVTEREAISGMESAVSDLEAVLQVVKAKREDLKDIQGRLRDQVKLCQEELNLGDRWGSSPPPDAPTRVDIDAHPPVDTGAMERMHAMVGSVGGESSVSDLDAFVEAETGDAVAPAEAERVPVPDEVDSLESFLAQVASPSPAPATVPDDEDEDDEVIPAPELVEDEVEAPVELPTVVEREAPVGKGSLADIDSFFNDLDLDPPKKVTPVLASEIDLDELLGSLSGNEG